MRSIVVRISVTASPGHRHAVAEFAHQRLGGMRQRFEPRQPEEAAGALDGVNQAKNVIQNLGVVRILLEPHQLIVDGIQALVGLRQKLPQQIIHENRPSKALVLRSTVNHSSRRRSAACRPRSLPKVSMAGSALRRRHNPRRTRPATDILPCDRYPFRLLIPVNFDVRANTDRCSDAATPDVARHAAALGRQSLAGFTASA